MASRWRKSMGAPIRLHLPWKYGFKSIKSINRVDLHRGAAKELLGNAGPSEYGFWANVNPRGGRIRAGARRKSAFWRPARQVPTVLWNGYGEQVASLYAGMESMGDKLSADANFIVDVSVDN